MTEVQRYVQSLEKQKVRVEGEIALKQRSLSRILEKLADPEYYLAKETKRGAVKVSRVLGKETVAPKPKSILRPKSSVSGDGGAANVAGGDNAEQEKKPSSWLNPFA